MISLLLAGNNRKHKYLQDNQAEQVYMAACRQLNIVPAHCFLKGLNTESINLNFQGLGPIGTRAVATAMVVRTGQKLKTFILFVRIF